MYYARLRYARILSASTPYSVVAASIVALAAWLTDRNLGRCYIALSLGHRGGVTKVALSCAWQYGRGRTHMPLFGGGLT